MEEEKLFSWRHVWMIITQQPVFCYVNLYFSPPFILTSLFWSLQAHRNLMIWEYYSHVWWSFYKCWLLEISHEIFYQLCQKTFLEKKKCYNMYWQHCVWCSVLSPSPLTSSWGYHFQKSKKLTKAWLQTVSSVSCWIFALCWVSYKSVKSEQVEFYIICLRGHTWEQMMIRACTKHPVLQRVWVYTMLCV